LIKKRKALNFSDLFLTKVKIAPLAEIVNYLKNNNKSKQRAIFLYFCQKTDLKKCELKHLSNKITNQMRRQ